MRVMKRQMDFKGWVITICVGISFSWAIHLLFFKNLGVVRKAPVPLMKNSSFMKMPEPCTIAKPIQNTQDLQLGLHLTTNYQANKMKILGYGQSWRNFQGTIYNPAGDRYSGLVEDYRNKISTISPKDCPKYDRTLSADQLIPKESYDSLRKIEDDFFEQGYIHIYSYTAFTHLADYPIPRMQKFYANLCTKLMHHDRMVMCTPEYRKGNKQIIGINQPCGYFGYVGMSPCKFVGPTEQDVVPGAMFDPVLHQFIKHQYHNFPPIYKPGYKIEYYDKLINGLQVYGAEHSHFIIECLPHLIYLLDVLPNDWPFIIQWSPFVSSFFEYLEKIRPGYVNLKRIIKYDLKDQKTLRYGNEVYFASEYPNCQNDCHRWTGPEFANRVKRAFVPQDLPFEQRKDIIVVSRDDAPSRKTANEHILIERLTKKWANHPTNPHRVVKFIGKDHKDVGKLIDVFKKAAIVIGVHGAGIANIMFSAPCTTVIELMWNNPKGLQSPSAFYALSISRKLDYFMVFGKGDYGTSVEVDFDEIEQIVDKVLEEKRAPFYEKMCWEFGNKDREYIKRVD